MNESRYPVSSRFIVAQVDLFESPEIAHCQWYPDALAHSWACTNICSPSEPTSTNTVQDQGGQGASPVSGSILAQQDPAPANSCPSRQPLPGRFLRGRICFLREGAPSGTRALDAEVLGVLSQEVALTITSP